MTVFDDAIAQAVAEYRVSEERERILLDANNMLAQERNAAEAVVADLRVDLATLEQMLEDADAATSALQLELAECRNPTPPRVPLGLYSGDLAEFKARKQMLGLPIPLTWAFPDMDDKITVAWDAEKCDPLIVNVHSVLRPSRQVPWMDVVNTNTYDAGLIGLFKSLAALVNTRVILSIQEEHDGKDNLHHGTYGAGTPAEYRNFFLKLKGLANLHAPNAKVWQVVADVDRLKDWFIPEADGYACDPHFYGWPGGLPQGGWFEDRLAHAAAEFDRLAPTKPFALHVGGYENPTGINSKPTYVRMMGEMLKTAKKKYPRLDHVTYWDRGAEAIDTSPATLAAFKEILA